MGTTKAGLRRDALQRRAALPAAARDRTARALCDAVVALAPRRVAAYASVGSEPATGPLLDALAAAHVPVLLPVLREDGELDWAVHDGPLVPGLRGTVEPGGPRLGLDALASCDLVVVPALGVDRAGTRLGRGGGAYDRALPRTTARVVAALHPGELHDALPAEPHDRPVDAAVLPGTGLVPTHHHHTRGGS